MAKVFTLKNGTILLSTEAPGGLYNSAQLKKIAAICDGGTAVVKATEDQRIAMFVKEGEAAKVASELKAIGLGIRNYQDGLHQPITCIGELCADHEQDALGSAMELTQVLSEVSLTDSLKIGINGCHRCCVPCHTFDISIIGDSAGYRISLGGKNSQIPEMASFVAEGVPYEKLAGLIRSVVQLYQKNSREGESLQDVMDRVGVGGFIAALSPYSQDAAAGADDPFVEETALEEEHLAQDDELVMEEEPAEEPAKKSSDPLAMDDEVAVENFDSSDVGDEITIGAHEGAHADDIAIDEDMLIDDDFNSEVLISEDHFSQKNSKKPSKNKDTSMVNDDVAIGSEDLLDEELASDELLAEELASDELLDDASLEESTTSTLSEDTLLEEEIVMEATDELIGEKSALESDDDVLALNTDDAQLINDAHEQMQDLSIGDEEISDGVSVLSDDLPSEDELLLDDDPQLPPDLRSSHDDLALSKDDINLEDDSLADENEIVLSDETGIGSEDDTFTAEEEEALLAEDEPLLDDETLLTEDESLATENDALAIEDDSLTIEDDSLTIEDDSLTIEDDSLTIEDDSLTIEDDSLTIEDDSLAIEDDSLTIEDDSLTIEDDSLTIEDDSLTIEDDSLTIEDDSLIIEDDALAMENDAPAAQTPKPDKAAQDEGDLSLSYINEDASDIEEDVDGQLETAVDQTIREEQLYREENQKDQNATERLAMMRSLHEEKPPAVRAIHTAPVKNGAKVSPIKTPAVARDAHSFTGVDFGDDGSLILHFASGMHLSVHPETFGDDGRQLVIAGKTIRFNWEAGGYHVEIDGITMFLPQAIGKVI